MIYSAFSTFYILFWGVTKDRLLWEYLEVNFPFSWANSAYLYSRMEKCCFSFTQMKLQSAHS